MSHNIQTAIYPENVNKAMVQAEWDECAARADWQEGCTGLGADIRWLDHVCENIEEACEWLKKRDTGWYDQLAVKFKVHKDVNTKAMKDLIQRIDAEENKLAKYTAEHSVLAFKAEYIGCPCCGSKLKKSFLKSDSCPVCKTDMRSNTTLETIKRYKGNIKDMTDKYKAEKEKAEKKQNGTEINWLVKIEYHT